jgi:hypothetical protein
MIHSSKANTRSISALSLADKNARRRLISQPDVKSKYPIIAQGDQRDALNRKVDSKEKLDRLSHFGR